MPVVELSMTDDSQLGSLESLLRREMPQITIRRRAGAAEPDALGWEDILTLAFAGTSALGFSTAQEQVQPGRGGDHPA